ncbi:MAG: energy transducer TonB [Spirochaetota bacterium]
MVSSLPENRTKYPLVVSITPNPEIHLVNEKTPVANQDDSTDNTKNTTQEQRLSEQDAPDREQHNRDQQKELPEKPEPVRSPAIETAAVEKSTISQDVQDVPKKIKSSETIIQNNPVVRPPSVRNRLSRASPLQEQEAGVNKRTSSNPYPLLKSSTSGPPVSSKNPGSKSKPIGKKILDKTNNRIKNHNKGLPVVAPDYSNNRKPVYPAAARARGYEGTVFLRIVIDDQGRVLSSSIEKSSGYRILDQSALQTSREWVFDPAAAGQKNIKADVIVPVSFKIRQE